jgi:acyl dehydratase
MVSQDQAGGNMPTEIIFDEIKIGETFGPVELLADEKMVREYCDERGDHNPIYLENSPFGGRVVPPALKASLMGQRTLATKYDMHATVPTKSEHEYLHPARVGKRLITTGKVTGKYIKRGLEYLIVESLTVDEDGIEIRRSKEHILLGLKRRHGNLTQGSEDSVGGSLFSRTAGPEAGRTVVSLNDFPVGSEIPSLTKVAYQSTLHTQVFLADSIHDAEYAKSHDYAGPLVSGYVLNEYMSEALVNFFGPGWLQGGMISLTFIRPGVQKETK